MNHALGRTALFVILALLVAFPFPGTGAESASVVVEFDGLRSLLLERNSRIRAADLEKEAAQSRSGRLARSFVPSLELHGAQETFKTDDSPWKNEPTFGAELKSNLYNGGKDQAESEIRSLEVERRSILREQVLSEELQSARKLFWEVVSFKERIELLDGMLKINSQNLASAEKRIRSGVATESDRVEFEMKAVDLRRDLADAKLRAVILTRQLAVLLGFESTAVLQLPNKLDHSHDFEEMVKHEAKDHEFLFRDDLLKARKSELEASKEKRIWLPQLEAYAGYKRFDEREEDSSPGNPGKREESYLGLRLVVRLDDLAESRQLAVAHSKEAAADFERAEFKKREIEAHMENEVSELRFLHDQVHDAEGNIARAEKYYKMTQSEYARGVKNSPDVLGASEKLFDSRLKRIEIIREFQIAKAHVLAKLGR